MLKVELEERLGYEISEEGYQILNSLYMNCDLDKDDFAKRMKPIAKNYQPKRQRKTITFAKWIWEKTPNGCYYVGVKEADIVDININTGKYIVENVRPVNGDGISYNQAQFSADQIVIKA